MNTYVVTAVHVAAGNTYVKDGLTWAQARHLVREMGKVGFTRIAMIDTAPQGQQA